MAPTTGAVKAFPATDTKVELKVTVDHDAACVDQEDSGFQIAGKNAKCSMLKPLCNSEEHGAQIKQTCTKTCGLCDEGKVGDSAVTNDCKDKRMTGLLIDGMKASCEILEPFCNSEPTLTNDATIISNIRS